MEILLWLYLYDDRWLLKIKFPARIYKLLWLIPTLIHLLLLSVGIYCLNYSDDSKCTNTIKNWIYYSAIFSIFIITNIMVFIFKIHTLLENEKSQINERHKYFNNSLILEKSNLSFWVRRNSLFSKPGILLLIQGFISLYYSFFLKILFCEESLGTCDYRFQRALKIHFFAIYQTNILILFVLFSMVLIKIFHFIMGMFFPRKYAMYMKFCGKFFFTKKKIISKINNYFNLKIEHKYMLKENIKNLNFLKNNNFNLVTGGLESSNKLGI